jgi:hypothetical protein
MRRRETILARLSRPSCVSRFSILVLLPFAFEVASWDPVTLYLPAGFALPQFYNIPASERFGYFRKILFLSEGLVNLLVGPVFDR